MKEEILKKTVELAEGFEWDGDCEPADNMITFGNYIMSSEDTTSFSGESLYPLLLRRAVEGLNPQWYECKIELDHIDITRMNPDNNYKAVWDKMYFYKDYQKTEYLTPQEQAFEACLIELFEE